MGARVERREKRKRRERMLVAMAISCLFFLERGTSALTMCRENVKKVWVLREEQGWFIKGIYEWVKWCD